MDLRDPLLAPFADGRASDFTRVRFWKRRLVDAAALPPGARVLARFDDGSPAWLVWPTGRGLLFVMTSGFGTDDSQLALSSKLVPLLWSPAGRQRRHHGGARRSSSWASRSRCRRPPTG